jgi:hypothetical protein
MFVGPSNSSGFDWSLPQVSERPRAQGAWDIATDAGEASRIWPERMQARNRRDDMARAGKWTLDVLWRMSIIYGLI